MKGERVAWGASLGAMLGYALAVLTSFPIRLLYFPSSGSWSTIDQPGGPPIRWYGSLVNAALGALLGAIVMRLVRARPPWSAIWVLALLALAVLGLRERHWMGL